MIHWCTLRVLGNAQLTASRDYYSRVLGMQEEDLTGAALEHARVLYRFAGSPHSAGLELITAGAGSEAVSWPYCPTREDLYWKIGLGLADVDAAAAALTEASLAGSVGPGSQFEDIGFLTHTADPQGFKIELLQTTFESSSARRREERARFGVGREHVLGQRVQPVVGQITLRIQDPEKSLAFYQRKLGMKLISVQAVEKYGFTLYFLAPAHYEQMVDCRTGEAHAIPPPPITLPGTSQPELAAVENREWCWQLPFTTLELQHRHNASERPLQASTDTAGFHSMTLAVPEGVISEQFSGEKEVRDPDGTLILLEVLQD
mmetsp:Transcript_25917/g.77402  ORF Transcript_25917/g.77402 Transcript_25917/m.77402 type:complete len:318 (-) Transcript_25917:234-1187(-)